MPAYIKEASKNHVLRKMLVLFETPAGYAVFKVNLFSFSCVIDLKINLFAAVG